MSYRIGFPCPTRHSNSIERSNARLLSLAEKKVLRHGETVWLEARCGCLLGARINGKVKTWKRDPSRVEVPYAFGLYEHGYIREDTAAYLMKHR